MGWGQDQGQKKKKKKITKRNRETKQLLVFDHGARREYLTGFKKRKDERRRIAAEQIIQEMKEEKKRLKQQMRDMMRARVENQPSVPEVKHLVDPQIFDLPSHTVTVTDVSEVDLSGSNGLWLGQNSFEDKTADKEGEKSDPTTETPAAIKTDMKEVKRLKRKMAKVGQSNIKKLQQTKKKSRRKKAPPGKAKRTKK